MANFRKDRLELLKVIEADVENSDELLNVYNLIPLFKELKLYLHDLEEYNSDARALAQSCNGILEHYDDKSLTYTALIGCILSKTHAMERVINDIIIDDVLTIAVIRPNPPNGNTELEADLYFLLRLSQVCSKINLYLRNYQEVTNECTSLLHMALHRQQENLDIDIVETLTTLTNSNPLTLADLIKQVEEATGLDHSPHIDAILEH